jgi:hypothetical protein
MRTKTIGRRVQRPGAGLLGSLAILPARARRALLDGREAIGEVARRHAPTVDERRDALRDFYDRYEAYVETLCDAAQYGPTEPLETRYARQREEYRAAYGPVSPFVGAFLDADPEDAGDAFARLAEAGDLASFLAADGGHVIVRIGRTRDALSRYADHLRTLADRRG